jgi:hypothetical protein
MHYHHNRASRTDDPIEIHHLQFGDWLRLCYRKEKKSNFSVRCNYPNFVLNCQVGDDSSALMRSKTGHTIPAIVSATTKQ